MGNRTHQLLRFFQSEKGEGKLNCLAASAAKDVYNLLQRLPAETDRSPKEWLFRTLFPSLHREWNSKEKEGRLHPIPEWPPEPPPPEETCVGWEESQEVS